MAKSTSSLASSSASSCSSRSSTSSSTTTIVASSKSDDKINKGDRLHMKCSNSMDRKKRLAANARERKRMHLLNEAYDELRGRLADAENKSKYDVLVQAKEYIQALASICEKFDKQNPHHPSVKHENASNLVAVDQLANEHLDRRQKQQQASAGPIMSPNVAIVISPSPPMSNISDATNETCYQDIITGTTTLNHENITTKFYHIEQQQQQQRISNFAQITPILFSPQPHDYSITKASTMINFDCHNQSPQYNLVHHQQFYKFPTNAT